MKTQLAPYQEALRYMENAKETLKKAGKDGGQYENKKYVKTASSAAYSAILYALDTLHLAGYYHGTTSVKTITSGFEDAYKIIEYIKAEA